MLQSFAFVFLYTAIAMAALECRLYEIDVVINKTVVYGVLAAFFTAVYVAIVVGTGLVPRAAQAQLRRYFAPARGDDQGRPSPGTRSGQLAAPSIITTPHFNNSPDNLGSQRFE